MKKIAIVLDEMSIGGIPKACVTFLNQLVNYFDVTMLMRRDDGELMHLLPESVHIKTIPHYDYKYGVKKLCSEHRYISLIRYLFLYVLYGHITNRWVKSNELTAKTKGVYIDDEYDCVIAYHGMSISHMVTALYSVKADKRVAWIHGDHPFEGVHKKDVSKVYAKFDKIFCVSPVMLERFLKDFPNTKAISDSYKNILEPENIKEKALSEEVDFDSNFINLVSVGRVSPEKGQDLIPKATRQLLDSGYKVRWYVVGDGDDMERIRSLCEEFKVTDDVILVGAKQNPYPYMQNCDIYVQPSYTEGYCLTVCEAAVLKKAMVITKDAAVAGVFVDGENAVVVGADSVELADGIKKLINTPNLKEKFVSNLAKEDFSNKDELKKLLDLLEV